MTTTGVTVDDAARSTTVPTASRRSFERFTAREAEVFLATRFAIFVARGLDCSVALRLATDPEQS